MACSKSEKQCFTIVIETGVECKGTTHHPGTLGLKEALQQQLHGRECRKVQEGEQDRCALRDNKKTGNIRTK